MRPQEYETTIRPLTETATKYLPLRSSQRVVVRLDLEGASRLDLGTLEAQGMPVTTLRAAE